MATKLLLIDDIDNLGRSGDIVSVRPGYARNFLLPQKLAVIADKRTIRMQARLQEERKQKAIEDKKEAEALAAQIETIHVTTTVKVDHDGHMYGSVTANDIIHLVKEQANIELERKYVQLKHAIKEVGVHTVSLKLKEGVHATVTLKIVPEESQRSVNA